MRHKIKGRKLNRTNSHRKALMRNLANQLFEHKEIKTTTAKAKEARITVERLITYAKKGDLHHRRLAFGFLRQKETIKVLFDEIAPTFTDRQGGYTRVIKLGRRMGDGAPMSVLQLVGFETLGEAVKPEKKKRTRKKDEKSDKQDQTKAATSVEDKAETEKSETVIKENQSAEIAETTDLPSEAKQPAEKISSDIDQTAELKKEENPKSDETDQEPTDQKKED